MSFQAFGRRWSIWVPIAAIIMVLALLVLLGVSGWLFAGQTASPTNPTAVFAIISAPTSTPAPPPAVQTSPTATPGSLIVGGIGAGMYVQISGTGGDGLRLRSGAGTNFPARFLGRESEVFQVRDGPKDADGYTWWYLVTPYDESRSGWAAASFLAVVAEPTP